MNITSFIFLLHAASITVRNISQLIIFNLKWEHTILSRKIISTICLKYLLLYSLFYEPSHFIRLPTTYYFIMWSLFSSKSLQVFPRESLNTKQRSALSSLRERFPYFLLLLVIPLLLICFISVCQLCVMCFELCKKDFTEARITIGGL